MSDLKKDFLSVLSKEEQKLASAIEKELEKELNHLTDKFAEAHRSILRLSICISVIGISVAILALKDILS